MRKILVSAACLLSFQAYAVDMEVQLKTSPVAN